MSDLVLQNYRRELERQGLSPREIAAGLLGERPNRFLFLVPALRDERDILHLLLKRPTFVSSAQGIFEGEYRTSRLMTGVMTSGEFGTDVTWEGLHAFEVFTLSELRSLMLAVQPRGYDCTLWDTETNSRSTSNGVAYVRVEDGWRYPRDRRNVMVHPSTQIISIQVEDVTREIERLARVNVYLNDADPSRFSISPERGPLIGSGTNWRADPAWEWPQNGPAPRIHADVTVERRLA